MSDLDSRLQQRAAQQSPPRSLETKPTSAEHAALGTLPNTPLAAAFIAFSLGIVFCAGGILAYSGTSNGWWWTSPQFGFYIASWAFFHWAEFAVTAGWNREKCSVDSFLLNNGWDYHIAHACSIAEYLITVFFWPTRKTFSAVSALGIAVTLGSQMLRSAAMIHASTNFSHSVQSKKADKHELVTSGVYSWSRHPSYTGFFYWGLGTQLALQNSLSFFLFLGVLWRFFSRRIRVEERYLVSFFGTDYTKYRERVGTKIPFIP